MPVIRKMKTPCVKVGMEVWEVENLNLKVGIIEKIAEGIIYIRRSDGIVGRRPIASLLMVKPTAVKE
jgi:hypothetical protein